MAAAEEDRGEAASLLDPHKTSSLDTEPSALQPVQAGSSSVFTGGWAPWVKEWIVQLSICGPLSGMLICMTAVNFISATITGRNFDAAALAAVNSANLCYWCFVKCPLIALAGALDTYASQAVGAKRYHTLPGILQRCLLFLAAHGLPFAVLLAFFPRIFRTMGEPPAVCDYVAQYVPGLQVALWLDIAFRPVNRTLVAQRQTMPQLVGTVISTALHFPIAYTFMVKLGWGVVGASWAYCVAISLQLAFVIAYVVWSGKASTVLGWPTRAALTEWAPFARLAYAGCLAETTEAFMSGAAILMTGLLPGAQLNTASYSITTNMYVILLMPLMAEGITMSQRVGSAMGAGDALQAQRSYLVALAGAPLFLAAAALLFLSPGGHWLIISMFTQTPSAALVSHVWGLSWLSVSLVLPTAIQLASGGCFMGMGMQATAMWINVIGQFLLGGPLAWWLAFRLHWGVEGIGAGLALGTVVQACMYLIILVGTDWEGKAARIAAFHRAKEQEQKAASTGSA